MSEQTTDGARSRPARPSRWNATVTTATLVVAVGGLPLLRVMAGDAAGPWARLALSWVVLAGVAVVALGVERRDLAALGARRPALRDVGWVVVTVVLATLAFAATDPLIEAVGLATTDGLDVGGSLALGIGAALTAGVVEETLYRGYAFERIAETDWGPTGAAVVTWLGFTLAHVPAGYPPGTLVQIGAAAGVFTLVYLRRRTIVPVIVAHVAVNVLGVLAAAYA